MTLLSANSVIGFKAKRPSCNYELFTTSKLNVTLLGHGNRTVACECFVLNSFSMVCTINV